MALPEAVELVLGRPILWALSASGFLARGGVLLLLAPLIELPSPISVTLFFGIDAISGTGRPSERLVTLIAVLSAATLGALVSAVVAAAWSDALVFARVAGESSFGPSFRGVLGLAWLQALGLLPALVALGLAAPAIRDAIVSEFLLPSDPAVPFVARVAELAQGPLLRVLGVLLLCEAVVTVATRLYLGRVFDNHADGASVVGSIVAALSWIVRHPVAAAGTWLAGMVVLLGAAGFGVLALALAWARVRVALLGSAFPDLGSLLVVVLLFVTVWLASTVLIGVASALRSVLWTVTVLSLRARSAGVRWQADADA